MTVFYNLVASCWNDFCSKITVLEPLLLQNTVNTNVLRRFLQQIHPPTATRSVLKWMSRVFCPWNPFEHKGCPDVVMCFYVPQRGFWKVNDPPIHLFIWYVRRTNLGCFVALGARHGWAFGRVSILFFHESVGSENHIRSQKGM